MFNTTISKYILLLLAPSETNFCLVKYGQKLQRATMETTQPASESWKLFGKEI